jgi:hypothetical protein
MPPTPQPTHQSEPADEHILPDESSTTETETSQPVQKSTRPQQEDRPTRPAQSKTDSQQVPENVIIEPPEKDLWASESQNIPRTTSAAPVRRVGKINRSNLLANQNIEIIKAQDPDQLDQELDADQEEEQ